jgi:hypothetical protein
MIFLPIYVVGQLSWCTIKTAFEVGKTALDTLARVGQQLRQGEYCEGVTQVWRGLSQEMGILSHGLFEIIKAPLFGLGVELAALYGIFKPYHGRKFEAMIEKAWQQGASYKKDVRIEPHPCNKKNCWEDFDTRPFYLAYCFQVRGNVHDTQRISVIKREPLTPAFALPKSNF